MITLESQFKENYYKTLKIKDTATKQEIKGAFKKLAIENHPDKGGSEEKMKIINEAYNVLSSDEIKKEYDIWYHAKFYPEKKAVENNTSKPEYNIKEEQYEFMEDYLKNGKPDKRNTIHNIELTAEVIEKIKRNNKSKNVFEVIVYTNPIIIPDFCACCLGISKENFTTTCTNHYLDREYTISFDFSICPRCKEHMLDFQLKTILLIASSIIMSLVCITALLLITNLNFIIYMILAILITASLIYGISFIIKPQKIEEMDSSRGKAVEVVSFGKDFVRFRFWNYMYAKVFADMNKAQVKKIFKPLKTRQENTLLQGKIGLQIIGYIFLIVIFFTYFIYNFYYVM